MGENRKLRRSMLKAGHGVPPTAQNVPLVLTPDKFKQLAINTFVRLLDEGAKVPRGLNVVADLATQTGARLFAMSDTPNKEAYLKFCGEAFDRFREMHEKLVAEAQAAEGSVT